MRGRRLLTLSAGYGASCDAYHITTPAPGGAGLAMAIEAALRSGGINKEEVGYVNAHGTSTAYNDKFETLALKVLALSPPRPSCSSSSSLILLLDLVVVLALSHPPLSPPPTHLFFSASLPSALIS